MVYFLVHKGTEKVFFEKRENFIETLKKSINLAEQECLEGFDFNITIGCAKNIEQQTIVANINHCFLIEKLWIDEMENRNPCGYSPFGYVKTEKEAKDICDNSRLLNGEDCWALKYIGSRKEYRYKEIKEITKEVINGKRDYY